MAEKEYFELTPYQTTLADGTVIPLQIPDGVNFLTRGILYSALKTLLSALYAPITEGVTNGDTHDHSGGDGGQIDHDGLANVSANDHHDENHTVASHSDTTATGTELEELTDGSETALHSHAAGGGNVVGPATHAADYVPQWNGTPNSKTLIEGFPISANGISLVGAANYAAMKTLLDLEIGIDIQAWDADLDTYAGITPSANVQSLLAAATYAAMRTLLNIEDGADVTDVTNVTAAGALMDSEVDADIKTLALPANTTISAAGAALIDDADAAAQRTTLGLGNAATKDTGTGSGNVAVGDHTHTRTFSVLVNNATALTSGNGKSYFPRIPSELNGWNVTAVAANIVAGTALVTIMIHNLTQAADILTTALTIDANEKDSKDAATAAEIDATEDDLATGDRLRIDIDGAGTGTTWLDVQFTATKP